MLKGQSEAGNR